METVGKQVQVVSGLGVGGPVGPVGPVGGDLHHHHHPHPHGGHGHSLVGTGTTPARVQVQSHQGQPPPPSHNQHLPARSTPVQLHRWVFLYIYLQWHLLQKKKFFTFYSVITIQYHATIYNGNEWSFVKDYRFDLSLWFHNVLFAAWHSLNRVPLHWKLKAQLR